MNESSGANCIRDIPDINTVSLAQEIAELESVSNWDYWAIEEALEEDEAY